MFDKIARGTLFGVHDRKGMASIEYGVLACAVAAAVAGAASVVSGDLQMLFSDVGTAISDAVTIAKGS